MVAGGLGETPLWGVAAQEVVIRCGGGASSSSGSRRGKDGRGMMGATIYRGKSLGGSRQRPKSSPQLNQRLVLEFATNRTKFNFQSNSFLRPQVSSDGVRAGGVCTKLTRCPTGS
jgi:hypothetical protein